MPTQPFWGCPWAQSWPFGNLAIQAPGAYLALNLRFAPSAGAGFACSPSGDEGGLTARLPHVSTRGHVPRGQRPYLVTMDSEPGERVDVRLKLLNGSVGRGWVGLLLASWHHCFIGSVLLEMESRLRKLVKLDVSEAGCALAEPQRECVCVRVCAQSCPTLRPHGL